MDKWLYFLKHLEGFAQLPELFQEDVFVETLERVDYLSLTAEDRDQYEVSLKTLRDNENVIDTALIEDLEKGNKLASKKG